MESMSKARYTSQLQQRSLPHHHEQIYRTALRVQPQSREGALHLLDGWRNLMPATHPQRPQIPSQASESRRITWIRRSAEQLAVKAGHISDEHGWYDRGDHIRVTGLDFVPPYRSMAAPYLDLGGEGLGLVEVERTRRYAKRYSYGPSVARTRFLVGRNESGTYFAHPVPQAMATVKEALAWMWQGLESEIIARQGDIALIRAHGGPRMPVRGLPRGHIVDAEMRQITHATHPAIPYPQRGERVIVARRSTMTYAARATRD